MDNEGVNTIENKKAWFNKKKLIIFSLLFVILIGSIYVVIRLNKGQAVTPTIASHTYTDKGKYFSIRIPTSWTETEDIAQGTTGLGTSQQTTQYVEEIQFAENPGTVIEMQVYEEAPTCLLDQPTNTTIAGFPASYDAPNSTWTIPTTKALITVTVSYPGSNTFYHHLHQTIPTPVPSAVAEQSKKYIMEILKTLKLTKFSPFRC